MLNNQVKDLWLIRFRKIYDLERDSFYFYRKLINSNTELLQDSDARNILRKIMRDELNHARAALELLKILENRNASKEGGGA